MKKLGDIMANLGVPKWEPCEQCRDHNGWVMLSAHSDRHTQTNFNMATRCSCWLAHQEKVQQALAKTKERV